MTTIEEYFRLLAETMRTSPDDRDFVLEAIERHLDSQEDDDLNAFFIEHGFPDWEKIQQEQKETK